MRILDIECYKEDLRTATSNFGIDCSLAIFAEIQELLIARLPRNLQPIGVESQMRLKR